MRTLTTTRGAALLHHPRRLQPCRPDAHKVEQRTRVPATGGAKCRRETIRTHISLAAWAMRTRTIRVLLQLSNKRRQSEAATAGDSLGTSVTPHIADTQDTQGQFCS